MTVGAAWIRKGERGEELWFASDSRLGGDGNVWDECPKLFALPRRDAAAAFSGATEQAYPLLLQMANAISGYQAAVDGTLEFGSLAEHLERVVNALLARMELDAAVHGSPGGLNFTSRGDVILIGGFSRHKNGLVLRALRHEKAESSWRFTRVRPRQKIGPGRVMRVYGDRLAASRYDHLLLQLLKARGKLGNARSLELEPLETLWSFLDCPTSVDRPLPMDRRPESIGGSPQVIRIRPGASATPFVIRWGLAGRQRDYLLGREVLPEENLDLPLIARTEAGEGLRQHARGQWTPIRPVPGPVE